MANKQNPPIGGSNVIPPQRENDPQDLEQHRLLATFATHIIDSKAFNNPDDTIDGATYGKKVAIATLTIYKTIGEGLKDGN